MEDARSEVCRPRDSARGRQDHQRTRFYDRSQRSSLFSGRSEEAGRYHLQHPELKLASPPRAINNFAGESNRVGSVRDFWPASKLESEVPLDPAKVEKYQEILEKKPG